jgi:hypothetical protein
LKACSKTIKPTQSKSNRVLQTVDWQVFVGSVKAGQGFEKLGFGARIQESDSAGEFSAS